MARLDDQLTPVTPAEVLAALEQAWQAQFGQAPHRTSLLVLVSQWALETGRGRSMHCFNLGNVKSSGQTGDWCFFRCNEIIGGKLVWFDPDAPECRFRAFKTLAEGAADYLKTLYQRFQKAWPAVLQGDPAGFSHLLRVQRYYTADEGQYTRTLVALFNEFSRTLAGPAPVHADAGDPLPNLYTVLGVQTALAKLGFHPGKLDGHDGPHTEAAVVQFQLAHGLVADGVVGRLTRDALTQAWRTAKPA